MPVSEPAGDVGAAGTWARAHPWLVWGSGVGVASEGMTLAASMPWEETFTHWKLGKLRPRRSLPWVTMSMLNPKTTES